MKAMILAAGRGERMRPLTDTLPKPLLTVNDVPLIDYHLKKLQRIGVKQVVINLAWLGEKIADYLQDGSRYDLSIDYSWETDGALETAGGIIQALPKLSQDDQPFLVVNGDVFLDYDFSDFPQLADSKLAHLWLVNNPVHNPSGDFSLNGNLLELIDETVNRPSYTFSGLGLYRPSFFNEFLSQKVMPLAPVIKAGIAKGAVSAEVLSGLWTDVGTPQRLAQLNQELKQSNV